MSAIPTCPVKKCVNHERIYIEGEDSQLTVGKVVKEPQDSKLVNVKEGRELAEDSHWDIWHVDFNEIRTNEFFAFGCFVSRKTSGQGRKFGVGAAEIEFVRCKQLSLRVVDVTSALVHKVLDTGSGLFQSRSRYNNIESKDALELLLEPADGVHNGVIFFHKDNR